MDMVLVFLFGLLYGIVGFVVLCWRFVVVVWYIFIYSLVGIFCLGYIIIVLFNLLIGFVGRDIGIINK